jgi:flagellar biosynthetic protein FliP
MSCRSAGPGLAILLSISLAVTAPAAAQGRFAPRSAEISSADATQLQSASSASGPADESSSLPAKTEDPATPSASSAVPGPAPAASPGGLQIAGAPGGSVPWSIVVMLTALTLVPSILVCMTPFARLLIVFHFLRQALGLQTTPSNQTLIGLSIILTFFLMQPVATKIYASSVVPMQGGQISAMEALTRAEAPVREFMSHYVREKDVALFIDLAKEPRPASISDVSMRVLLPAYILSELKAGFQIGTVLFLPFLIVDMVVASITTSVGMLQLPPVVISTPLKLLLFLVVDGWHLLIGSLMRSFQ